MERLTIKSGTFETLYKRIEISARSVSYSCAVRLRLTLSDCFLSVEQSKWQNDGFRCNEADACFGGCDDNGEQLQFGETVKSDKKEED